MSEWHARFERDARFRRAVEAEYEGAHDVGDAIWWLDHPSHGAPSGQPSPRCALADLERAAFARPADAGGEARAIAARGELEAIAVTLRADRAEAQRAVDEALRALDARPALRRRTTVLLAGAVIAAGCLAGIAAFAATTVIASQSAGGGSGSASQSGDGADGAGGAPGDNGNNAAEAAADGAGSSADGGSSYSATGGADEVPVPGLTAAPYPNFPPGIGADSYAVIFSRAQVLADLPPSEPSNGLLTQTFRALSIGQNSPGAVYAAVNTSSQVCLVVYGNLTDSGYTCDEADLVAARGLQVSLTTRDHRDPASGLVTPGVGLSARWQPDGAVTVDSSLPYDRD